MEHTPGPWRWYERTDSIYPWGIATETNGDPEAPAIHLAAVRWEDTEGEANARLIASAPELLEALEILADWPRKSERVDGVLSTDPQVGLANVRRHARAAIKAAKGE